jgi:hypothetical protein
VRADRQHGLKVYDAGEWLVEKHGQRTRRNWRELHLAVDAHSGQIVASVLTWQDVEDPSQVGPLLDQIPQEIEIEQVTADGAYDSEPTYDIIAAQRGMRKNRQLRDVGESCKCWSPHRKPSSTNAGDRHRHRPQNAH